MVSALDSGSSGAGSGHFTLTESQCPRCINGYQQNAGGNPVMD